MPTHPGRTLATSAALIALLAAPAAFATHNHPKKAGKLLVSFVRSSYGIAQVVVFSGTEVVFEQGLFMP